MNRKGFASIIILFIVVGVLAIGGIWYYQTHKAVPSLGQVQANQISASSIPTVSIDNWKTYHSDKYGFEFQYPPDWKVLIQESTGTQMFAGMVKISAPTVVIDLQKQEIKTDTYEVDDEFAVDFFQDLSRYSTNQDSSTIVRDTDQPANFSVGGVPAYRGYDNKDNNNGGKGESVSFLHNNDAFQFYFHESLSPVSAKYVAGEDRIQNAATIQRVFSIYDKILSTFEFF